jgi:immunity protein, SdpI family
VAAVSHDRFRYGLIAAAFCVSVLFFIRLPAIVGHHVRIPWLDFPRFAISFAMVGAALAIVLIFKSLAKRDPLRRNHERFRRTYDLFLDLAVVLAVGVHLLLLGTIMIHGGRLGRWVSYAPTTLVGLVLLVAGNALPRLRPNSVMGVRTRWTLADEAVWRRTHLAGGYVLTVFGLTLIVWTFIDFQGIWWVLGPGFVVTFAGLPVLSWLIGRRRPRPSPDPGREAIEHEGSKA